MFKAIAHLFRAASHTAASIENVAKAGEVASQSVVTLAENFDTQQKAVLKAKREKIDQKIADNNFDFSDI